MNQGVIAPGNHWISDPLRGAPPSRRTESPYKVRTLRKTKINNVIPRPYSRVASLVPMVQFTFWESPVAALRFSTLYQEIAASLRSSQ